MWYYDDSLPETLTNEELKQFCEKNVNEYLTGGEYEQVKSRENTINWQLL